MIVRELEKQERKYALDIIWSVFCMDVAKVYVSVMGREDGPKPAIEALNRAAGHVRTEVSKKMHIRKAPRFIFVEDDGAAYAAHINELLRTLNVNGDAEDSQPAETEE